MSVWWPRSSTSTFPTDHLQMEYICKLIVSLIPANKFGDPNLFLDFMKLIFLSLISINKLNPAIRLSLWLANLQVTYIREATGTLAIK